MTQIRAEKLYQDATSYVTCNLYEMCHVILNTLKIIHDNGLLLSTDFQNLHARIYTILQNERPR